jgi:hypothetical protein
MILPRHRTASGTGAADATPEPHSGPTIAPSGLRIFCKPRRRIFAPEFFDIQAVEKAWYSKVVQNS